MFPQATAMATARDPSMTGAFHGAMPKQTPSDLRCDIAKVPVLFEGMTSPVICGVIDAALRNIPTDNMQLKPAHGPVAPVSAIIVSIICGVISSSASAAFSKSARRSPGPVLDQI